MRLEQQVVSLELAQKLKELGVKQDSLFRWVHTSKYPSGYGWQIKYGNDVYAHVLQSPLVSAFTVAELGEMLPSGFNSGRADAITKSIPPIWFVRDQPNDNQWIGVTEADARAKMLVYLLENKLITL